MEHVHALFTKLPWFGWKKFRLSFESGSILLSAVLLNQISRRREEDLIMKSINKTNVCNILCALLMLALLAVQFTPFWQCGEEMVSIGGFIWFPTDHVDLEKQLVSVLQTDFAVDDMLAAPIMVLLLGAVGTVLCLLKFSQPMVLLLPVACGLSGLIGYLSTPALKTGMGWQWHVAICAAMLIVAIAGFAAWWMENRNEAK